ncbi:hypothetical protein RRG08_021193 [Elysia crispata]|uniref:Uncharacterized protein n=1 Tax=Elysia crispata TaxID=231223 RepID=A0AAE1D2N9_9GAST|nr:hypothetical protein RRG08_021193 [Elysia crispata]
MGLARFVVHLMPLVTWTNTRPEINCSASAKKMWEAARAGPVTQHLAGVTSTPFLRVWCQSLELLKIRFGLSSARLT